jgi:hypothetical protein
MELQLYECQPVYSKEDYFFSYTLCGVIGDVFCNFVTMDGTYAHQVFSNLEVRTNAMHVKQKLYQILTSVLSVKMAD